MFSKLFIVSALSVIQSTEDTQVKFLVRFKDLNLSVYLGILGLYRNCNGFKVCFVAKVNTINCIKEHNAI